MLELLIRAVVIRARLLFILAFRFLLQRLYNDLGPLLCLGLSGRLLRTRGKLVKVTFLLVFSMCKVEDECVEHVCVADDAVEIVVRVVGFLCQLLTRLMCDHGDLRRRHLLLIDRSR